MEVIYTGLHQTPEQIVETAIAEDADAIGLSVLSGAHMTLFKRVRELLTERDADDIVVFGGGIIPDADLQPLAELGVHKIFTPGATTDRDRRVGPRQRRRRLRPRRPDPGSAIRAARVRKGPDPLRSVMTTAWSRSERLPAVQ